MEKPFLYSLMLSDNIQNTIKAHSKGTTILHASEAIKYMKFVYPEDSRMNDFNKVAEPIMKSVLLLAKKNANLRQTHNLLLLHLISGELDVEKLDIKVGN